MQIGLGLGVVSREHNLTEIQKAISILKFYGTDAHVYIPGIGMLNGLTVGNYLTNDGSTGLGVVDQPVGLMLDAAGSVGVELVTNGDFASGLTGWAATNGTPSASSGIARVTSTAAAQDCRLYSAFSTVVGETYKVSGLLLANTGGTNATLSIGNGGGFSTIASGAASATPRTSEFFFKAQQTTQYVWWGVGQDTGQYFEIDNVSVKQVTGIHATASGAARPTLRRGSVNLALNSVAAGSSIGTPGTLPTGWFNLNLGVPGLSTSVVSTTNGVGIRIFGTCGSGHIYFALPSVTGKTSVVASGEAYYTGNKGTGGLSLSSLELTAATTGYVGEGAPQSLGTTSTRLSSSRSPSVSNFVTTCIHYVAVSAEVVDFTVYFSNPQLEIGQVAGDYSPTTTTAASNPSAGRYWHQYDGVDDSFALGSVPFQASDDFAVIAGVNRTSRTATYETVFGVYGATAFIALTVSNTGGAFVSMYNDVGTQFATGETPNAWNAPFVLSGVKRTGNWFHRKDAVASGNRTPSGTYTLTSANIGRGGGAGGTSYTTGALGPVIAIKGTVSDTDLLTLERFVASLTPSAPSF